MFPGLSWAVLARILVFPALLLIGTAVNAADDEPDFIDQIDKWRFQTSLWTKHFTSRPDHDNTQELVNMELWLKNKWHGGLAFFDNSYGQSSQYVYIGKAWSILDSPHFYVRVTGGLIHGYKDEYKHKIPLNNLGIAPAIVPAFGAQYGPVFTEIQTLGVSAVMWTVGLQFK